MLGRNTAQVLRFFCVWDDRTSLQGDRRPYRVHFFLEDDTVEVRRGWQCGLMLPTRHAACNDAFLGHVFQSYKNLCP